MSNERMELLKAMVKDMEQDGGENCWGRDGNTGKLWIWIRIQIYNQTNPNYHDKDPLNLSLEASYRIKHETKIVTRTVSSLGSRNPFWDQSVKEKTFFVGDGFTFTELNLLAEIAMARVKANMPKDIDIKKLRRRIEEELRKKATTKNLVAIAGLLGVKIE